MDYPVFPGGFPDRGPDLVRTYVRTIGDAEPDNRPVLDSLNHTDPHYAALLAARACIALVADPTDSNGVADRILTHASAAIEPIVGAHDRITGPGARVVNLSHLVTLLSERDNPAALNNFQIATHDKAIQEINRRTKGGTAEVDEKDGVSIAEWRTLALLNRYAHPWFAAFPALYQWDNSHRHSANYDLLTVESGPEKSIEPSAARVQVKHQCLGFCGETTGKRMGDDILDDYAKNIVLISGHCDLQLPYQGDADENYTLDSLLVREYNGTASPEEIHALDTITDRLMLIITAGDPRRHGRRRVEMSVPYRPLVTRYRPPNDIDRLITPASLAIRRSA